MSSSSSAFQKIITIQAALNTDRSKLCVSQEVQKHVVLSDLLNREIPISSIERRVSVLTLVWSAQPAGLPTAPACTPAAVSDRASHVPASLYVLHTEDFISTSVGNESAQSTLTELEVNWGCCTRKTASNSTFVAQLRVLHPLNRVVDEDHHAKDCSVGHCCEGKGVSI